MFNQKGLSFDQAPPISIVLRFFFGGAIFGIFAGAIVWFYGVDIFEGSSKGAITFTHILTLGVMLSFMLGALFQMLPVLAGVVLQSPIQKANWIQYPLLIGTLILLLAFNLEDGSIFFIIASLVLGITMVYVSYLMLGALIKVQYHTTSSKGMIAALLSLVFLVLFALYLTSSLSGLIDGKYYLVIKEAHYSMGLFGWITLLIMAISFQVIEMFYVTPPYPKMISQYLPMSIVFLLIVFSLLTLITPHIGIIKDVLLSLALGIYASITLKRLSQRKRPVADSTVWFWRLGMISLLLCMILMSLELFIHSHWITKLSYVFFTSFALSIVFAMFYKIVPFLTWFHLNSQGYFSAPMMHEVIHPQTAKKHFWIHLMTIVLFLFSIFLSKMIFLAALLLMISFSWLGFQVIYACYLYRKTQKEGEKFDMNIGS